MLNSGKKFPDAKKKFLQGLFGKKILKEKKNQSPPPPPPPPSS